MLLFTGMGAVAQQVPAMSARSIIWHTSSKDTVYVINFWATWCAPCVHELPEFNKLKTKYAAQPVKVILVSLDFKEDVPAKLSRFLQRQKVTPEVIWLSDTDPNQYIPTFDDKWEGSIPATIVVYPGKGFKRFIEGTVTAAQISSIVDDMLKGR